jgi:ferrous iron transport protein A
VIRNAPLMDPVEVKMVGYHVSIRHSEAAFVEVE